MPETTPLDPAPPAARALAWLGGAAFVGSLGYFVWFYVVELGRTAPAGSPAAAAVAIDAGLFALFAVHHSAMARAGAKRWLTRHLPAAFERSIYVWVASALFFAVCWWWQDVPGRIYHAEGWAALPFRLAQVAGVVLTLGSARAIDVFDLAGIRQVSSPWGKPGAALRPARRPAGKARRPSIVPACEDGAPRSAGMNRRPNAAGLAPLAARHGAGAHTAAGRAPGRLETGGAYRLVRHPIYLGTLLLMAATPDLTAGRLLFTALSLVYLIVGVALEERSLVDEFGPAYEAYRATVRWRMIPGIY